MSWARLDDRANEHRKQLAAGAEACWLWACGLMYTNRQPQRDGFIPEQMLPMLYPLAPKRRQQLCAKLVEVGLWDKVAGGYQVHDFTEWNATREQVEREREQARERMRRVRANRGGGSGEHNPNFGDGSGSSPLPSTPNQTKPDESAREAAPCPLDLTSKAESLGIISEFAEKYRAEPEQLRKCTNEFVSYWTIGGGMGRKEANWPKKLREHLRRTCEKPGGLEPPGAIQHAQHQRKTRGKGGAPSALAEVIGDYVPSENVPYHQTWSPKS